MKYAVDANTMRLIDQFTIETEKIPAMVLMERAAEEVAAAIMNKADKTDLILAVCGPGNNGGDGVAAGRILFLQGYHVAILFVGDESKATPECKQQMDAARKLGIKKENCDKLDEYNIIIDALFGVGLSRPVSGIYEEIIHKINEGRKLVFSVDIPSGISADNGRILNAAVKADYTITFGYQKLGTILYPGADYSGVVIVADIGFSKEALLQKLPDTFYYEAEDLLRLPKRTNYSNKGTYGKVLIIAGSKGMSGAAYLSAKSAYRTGTGLVKVLTGESNRIIIQSTLPEALFGAYDGDEAPELRKEKLVADLSWASAVVIGPGLGQSETSEELLHLVLNYAKVPLIIDADAINLLAKYMDDRSILTSAERLKVLSELYGGQLILTPHLMELSRLLNIPLSDIANNLIDTAEQCSYNNLIVAIKDARTIVTQKHNKYINISGNNGMATGGSGDVLTGIIAALIAQGMLSYEATCLAVYIHGLAGDVAAGEKGYYSMMASDIIASIEKVLMTITRKG